MSASQLLRILQTLPVGVDAEICANFNTDEVDANLNKISKSTNPFLSDQDNDKLDFWNKPELEASIFANERFYVDKHSLECELPELMVCYKESDFRVKDICVDEGIPDNQTISTISGHYMDAELNSSVQNTTEKSDFCTNLQNDDSTEQLASDSMFSLQQDWSLTSLEFPGTARIYSDDVDPQPLQGSEEEFSETAIEESDRNDQMMNISNESDMEGNVAFRFDTGRTAKSSDPCEAMNPETVYELRLNQDVAPGKVAVANQETRYTRGDSSFSMAGVISELISCSRPMPFAAGISNRSDSNATSTRSFAFPTLESEYISSPTRMGKSERRRLQKRLRQGLCCKF